ncbi:MAG: hypothetical protein JNL17_16685 [Cyclobacteriaceae bacterium]|nr:hypothetical protein [Cyclobacteriaceae bacterium]
MKELLTITTLLITTFAFGQKADTSKITRYVIGDRVIECNDCWTDFCGNLFKTNGDTLATNSRPLNSTDNPIYLTKNNMLLSTVTAKKLTENKNVKSLTVIKCNNGRPVFGDIAKNGIIIVELKNEFTDTVTLTQYLSTKYNSPLSDPSIIYINGLLTSDRNMKVSKSDFIKVHYDKTTNSYNIMTE